MSAKGRSDFGYRYQDEYDDLTENFSRIFQVATAKRPEAKLDNCNEFDIQPPIDPRIDVASGETLTINHLIDTSIQNAPSNLPPSFLRCTNSSTHAAASYNNEPANQALLGFSCNIQMYDAVIVNKFSYTFYGTFVTLQKKQRSLFTELSISINNIVERFQ